MEVHAEHAVGTGRLHQVRDQLRPDRDARLVLPVLACVPVVRHGHRHPRGRCAARRIHQEQQLHEVVGRRRRGLDDEDVPATRVLVDPDENFAIGEALDRHVAEWHSHVLRDLLGQRPVGGAGEEQEWATELVVGHSSPRRVSSNSAERKQP